MGLTETLLSIAEGRYSANCAVNCARRCRVDVRLLHVVEAQCRTGRYAPARPPPPKTRPIDKHPSS
jgi:hypothetical protein